MARVRDLMQHNVVTIGPDQPILEAIKKMAAGKFRRLPVMDKGRLVGIISDRDLRRALKSPIIMYEKPIANYLLRETKVGSCMTMHPLTVSPDTDAIEAAGIMEHRKIGGLPVVEGSRLVGVITLSDLINFLIQAFEENPQSSN